jgi:hypothetical protein
MENGMGTAATGVNLRPANPDRLCSKCKGPMLSWAEGAGRSVLMCPPCAEELIDSVCQGIDYPCNFAGVRPCCAACGSFLIISEDGYPWCTKCDGPMERKTEEDERIGRVIYVPLAGVPTTEVCRIFIGIKRGPEPGAQEPIYTRLIFKGIEFFFDQPLTLDSKDGLYWYNSGLYRQVPGVRSNDPILNEEPGTANPEGPDATDLINDPDEYDSSSFSQTALNVASDQGVAVIEGQPDPFSIEPSTNPEDYERLQIFPSICSECGGQRVVLQGQNEVPCRACDSLGMVITAKPGARCKKCLGAGTFLNLKFNTLDPCRRCKGNGYDPVSTEEERKEVTPAVQGRTRRLVVGRDGNLKPKPAPRPASKPKPEPGRRVIELED